jgi:hypothetical protein
MSTVGTPQGARPAAQCDLRAVGWVRDPAVWAWAVVVLLALLPLRAVLA